MKIIILIISLLLISGCACIDAGYKRSFYESCCEDLIEHQDDITKEIYCVKNEPYQDKGCVGVGELSRFDEIPCCEGLYSSLQSFSTAYCVVEKPQDSGRTCTEPGYKKSFLKSCCEKEAETSEGTYCIKTNDVPLGECSKVGETWFASDFNCCEGLLSIHTSKSGGYCVIKE